jgi:hypothetical protein
VYTSEHQTFEPVTCLYDPCTVWSQDCKSETMGVVGDRSDKHLANDYATVLFATAILLENILQQKITIVIRVGIPKARLT